MFEEKDRSFFEGAIDKIEGLGESIGLKINKKSRVVIKTVLISLAVITIGGLIFIWTILKRSFKSKE